MTTLLTTIPTGGVGTQNQSRQLINTMTDEKKVICTTCRIQFENVFDYKMHITSEYHVYNTKRRVASLEPISEEIFEQKKATLALQSQVHS